MRYQRRSHCEQEIKAGSSEKENSARVKRICALEEAGAYSTVLQREKEI